MKAVIKRHLGNEYDELFLEICNKINIKIEIYDMYVDDQNTALRSFGRKVKFCPLDGELVPKTDDEIEVQKDLHEDQGRNFVGWPEWILKNPGGRQGWSKALYRSKEWRKDTRWKDKNKKSKNWLGSS